MIILFGKSRDNELESQVPRGLPDGWFMKSTSLVLARKCIHYEGPRRNTSGRPATWSDARQASDGALLERRAPPAEEYVTSLIHANQSVTCIHEEGQEFVSNVYQPQKSNGFQLASRRNSFCHMC